MQNVTEVMNAMYALSYDELRRLNRLAINLIKDKQRLEKLTKHFLELRKALCECMRYVESTHGKRGDLVGCAVNKNEYSWWEKLTKIIS